MVLSESAIRTRDEVDISDTWDLSDIYTSDAEFAIEVASLDNLIAAVVAFQGRLGESAQSLLDALNAAVSLQHVVERISVYAKLTFDQDTTNSDAQSRMDQATAASIKAGQALSWFDPELLEVDPDTLQSFIAEDSLAPFRHVIDDIVRNRQYTKTPEIESILVSVSDIARTARESFGALDNADITYGTVNDEDGLPVELTKGRYHLFMESRNRELRKEAYLAFTNAYVQHKHVLAALHAGTVRKDVFYAKTRGFDSALQMALNANNIDEQVYDTLIDVTRKHTDTVARYLELRRQLLDVEQLEIYDSWVPLSELPAVQYSWAEAVDVVCAGLAPLGREYVEQVRIGLTTGRWADVHETKGKRSGAYSWGAYGSHPVILMNWNGTLSDVFTLAHEAGHAMHSFLADRAQPYQSARYSIFLAEIASTLNEVLLTWHLLGQIPKSDAMSRFAILNRFADQIMGTHIRQAMFAEFERETHRIVEQSQPLVLQNLSELYSELYKTYTPGINCDELTAIGWSRVPHFYNGFYVFQYATGISAGIALARAVRDEGQPAVERVIKLFEQGGSDYPLPVLKAAGVDLTQPDAIEACMTVFADTVTELEQIVASGAFTGTVS